RGKRLYQEIGCVACHGDRLQDAPPGESAARPDPQQVPLVAHGSLEANYDHDALTKFLRDPLRLRPGGRMPDFQLSLLDAADIAHYLLGRRTVRSSEPFRPAPQRVAAGKALFSSFGCANCHSLSGVKATLSAPSLAALADAPDKQRSGCWGETPRGRPRFALSGAQQAALQAAIDAPANARPEASQRLDESLARANCYACHTRDGRGGVGAAQWDYFRTVGNVDIGDEGRIPPPLSGVGGKLTAAWMAKVLAGKAAIRPHMAARMPVFGKVLVDGLPEEFQAVDLPHGDAPPRWPPVDAAAMQAAGRELMNNGCIQCHAVAGRRMTGVVGVEISQIDQRLRPSWFVDFLMNPAAKRPQTRMPTMFPNGKSLVDDVLDGNAARQTHALWLYLN
ncbi:MAG: c-type cytochrome, partial [Planctomycetales bacterium]|nr:c-type cytochrome [Planctomycetales bacterium]